jgi:hypothetical protein
MLQRLIEDARMSAGSAARAACFGVVMAVSLFVVTGFLSAAAFLYVMPKEGAVAACFAGGAVFFAVALIAATVFFIKQEQDRKRTEAAAARAAQSAKSAASSLFSDPATIAIGLQIVRAVGVRRMIPLLAIGGVALGLMAGQRERKREPSAESD